MDTLSSMECTIQNCEDDDNREMEGETMATHNEEQLSDDGLEDHNKIINMQSDSITYQSNNEEYSIPDQGSDVKIVKVVPLPHARSEVWSYFGFIADDDGEIKDKKKAICKICASTLAYSGNTTNLFTHLKAMHPEANPTKLAPTNKSPRTGRKGGKRKYFDLGENSYDSGNTITLGSGNNQPSYIVRAITFSGADSGSSATSFFEDGTNLASETNVAASNINKSPPVKAISISTPTVISSDLGSPTQGMTPNIVNSENVPLLSCDDITNAIVNMLVEDCRPICVTQSKGFEDLVKLLAPGYKIPTTSELKPMVKKRHKEVQRNLILRGLEDA